MAAAAAVSNLLSSLSLNSNNNNNNNTSPNKPTNNSILPMPKFDLSPLVVSSNDVVYPAAVHANTLFFKSGYNVQVIVDEKEHEEALINRFRKKVLYAGVIQEAKRRRWFENPHDKAKRKARTAAKRNRRPRHFKPKNPYQDNQEDNRNKGDEDDGDNWELTDGDLPAHEYLVHLSRTNNRWDNDEKGSTGNHHFDTPHFPVPGESEKKKMEEMNLQNFENVNG